MSKQRAPKGAPNAFVDMLFDGTTESDQCIIWPYKRDKLTGYANFGTRRGPIYTILVHREVCRRQNGMPPPGPIDAAHECGNGGAGCVNPRHLTWKTKKENKADELRHGTRARGESAGNVKLKEMEVHAIRYLLLTGCAQKMIAEAFGISQSVVSHIKHRRTWGHL